MISSLKHYFTEQDCIIINSDTIDLLFLLTCMIKLSHFTTSSFLVSFFHDLIYSSTDKLSFPKFMQLICDTYFCPNNFANEKLIKITFVYAINSNLNPYFDIALIALLPPFVFFQCHRLYIFN